MGPPSDRTGQAASSPSFSGRTGSVNRIRDLSQNGRLFGFSPHLPLPPVILRQQHPAPPEQVNVRTLFARRQGFRSFRSSQPLPHPYAPPLLPWNSAPPLLTVLPGKALMAKHETVSDSTPAKGMTLLGGLFSLALFSTSAAEVPLLPFFLSVSSFSIIFYFSRALPGPWVPFPATCPPHPPSPFFPSPLCPCTSCSPIFRRLSRPLLASLAPRSRAGCPSSVTKP